MVSLDTENRNGYIVTKSIKKIWTIQIELVQKLLEVCSRNKLKIWADGGTLLGAVREHGYIPWDDDIDMLMLRDDYDKLVSIAEEEFSHPYFFQCAHTDKGYYRGHAQLRYDGTTAILPYDVKQTFHQGIFIDIFVYDEIPDIEDENWQNALIEADKISHELWQAKYPNCSIFHPSRSLNIIKSRLYCRLNGYKRLFDEYENLFRRYNGKGFKRIACPCFNRNIFKTATKQKCWYDDTIWLPFESISLPVPIGYDDVLKTQYGADYMTPRQAPSLHGGFLALDTETPYSVYLSRFQKDNRKEKWSSRWNKLLTLFNRV